MPEPSRAARTRRRSAPSLSQDRIVAAALDVLDDRGLDGLSLRKVAAELGAGVNSLYWYVNSKEELLDLVADAVLAQLRLPDRRGDWRTDCRVAMSELRTLLLRHPHAVAIVVTRPPTGPAALRSSEWILQALSEAGFAGIDLQYVHATLLTYTFGKVSQEVAWQHRAELATKKAGLPDQGATSPAATRSGFVGVADALIDGETYPRSRELLELIFTTDHDAEFHAGLDAILAGFDPGT